MRENGHQNSNDYTLWEEIVGSIPQSRWDFFVRSSLWKPLCEMRGNNTFKVDGGGGWIQRKKIKSLTPQGGGKKKGGEFSCASKKKTPHSYVRYIHTHTHARESGWKIVIGPHSEKARSVAAEGEWCLVVYCDVFVVPAVVVGAWAHLACLFGLRLPNVCERLFMRRWHWSPDRIPSV